MWAHIHVTCTNVRAETVVFCFWSMGMGMGSLESHLMIARQFDL